MTFGTAKDDAEECYALGKGPAIGISAVLLPELSQALTETAKRKDIPYQLEIMPESTGTDADALALAPDGCAAGTVSIPLRYMHTPVETAQIEDMESILRLITGYVAAMEG